jgi:hypothetical protein
MKGFLRTLEGLALFGLAFLFLRWFIQRIIWKIFYIVLVMVIFSNWNVCS